MLFIDTCFITFVSSALSNQLFNEKQWIKSTVQLVVDLIYWMSPFSSCRVSRRVLSKSGKFEVNQISLVLSLYFVILVASLLAPDEGHKKTRNLITKGSELGAGRGSRTPKGRSPADFESAASASSAIPAWDLRSGEVRLIDGVRLCNHASLCFDRGFTLDRKLCLLPGI